MKRRPLKRAEATKEELYQFHVRIPTSIMIKVDEETRKTGAPISFLVTKGLKMLLGIKE